MDYSNKIYFRQIRDNFWYGVFGEFKLIVDTQTGYFNATKLCQSGNKKLDNWFKLDSSKKLIDYYTNITKSNRIFNIDPASANPTDLLISGTYMCDELLLSISSWISIEFYFKSSKIIKQYIIGKIEKSRKITIPYTTNIRIRLKNL